jgi:hypothetical protein
MHINAKKITVETVPRIRGGGNKRDWGRGSI